ncbi:uncharacterized protein LOC108673936 [Hyalella azteca]|uniref:Uncharacterized protein LOC108673936 n=1 Tax=Hyalella azteca TaxID=294128 RepID=A0A8B7NWN8_HYAAZ|nr:uncharacterized protein LOC108673936 [Hyalella azteca]
MEANMIFAVLLLTIGLSAGRPVEFFEDETPVENYPEFKQTHPYDVRKSSDFLESVPHLFLHVYEPRFSSADEDSLEQFENSAPDVELQRVVRSAEPEGIEVFAKDLIAEAESTHTDANAEGNLADVEGQHHGTDNPEGEPVDGQPADVEGRFFLGKLFGKGHVSSTYNEAYATQSVGYNGGLNARPYVVLQGGINGGLPGVGYGGIPVRSHGEQLVHSREEYLAQSHINSGYNNLNPGYYVGGPPIYRPNYVVNYGDGGYRW